MSSDTIKADAFGSDGSADLLAYLFLGLGPLRVRELVAATIGPLIDYDQRHRTYLVETLLVYLDNMGNVRATATQCHAHINSIYYRLDRVRDILGDRWQEGDHLLLHLVLRTYWCACGDRHELVSDRYRAALRKYVGATQEPIPDENHRSRCSDPSLTTLGSGLAG